MNGTWKTLMFVNEHCVVSDDATQKVSERNALHDACSMQHGTHRRCPH